MCRTRVAAPITLLYFVNELRHVWLNPEAEQRWEYTSSIQITQELLGDNRMFPMTLEGLDRAIKRLTH